MSLIFSVGFSFTLSNISKFDLVKQDGLTALHRAIIGKKEAVISHLLRKGANPHVRDRVRITLFLAQICSSLLFYLVY